MSGSRPPADHACVTETRTESPTSTRTFEAFIIDGWWLIDALQDPALARLAEALNELAARGVPIAVVTSQSSTVTAALQTVGLAGLRVVETDVNGDAGEPATTALLGELERQGIGAGLVLAVGLERTSTAVPFAGKAPAFADLVEDQARRRAEHRVPAIDNDPRWVVSEPDGRHPEAVLETIFTVGGEGFGTRGAAEEGGDDANPLVLAAGIYTTGERPDLVPGPIWTDLQLAGQRGAARRSLDLRTGVLVRELTTDAGAFRSLRFVSAARPGVMVLWTEAPVGTIEPGPVLSLPDLRPEIAATVGAESGEDGADGPWATVRDQGGAGITAVARQRRYRSERPEGVEVIVRLAVYGAEPDRAPAPAELLATLAEAEQLGVEALLAEHRAVWAERWADAGVTIEGDAELERAVRFANFQLLAAVPATDEAAVGARGLSGGAYLGHVFWDTDIFVLPALAGMRPEAARAMVEYRARRRPAAHARAAQECRAGYRFPWESAQSGVEVTPTELVDHTGTTVRIYTGEIEEHITADVAWAARHYTHWSGDHDYFDGTVRDLIIGGAEYWASRVEIDEAGTGHIDNVIGPDEYHEHVDDNAYTNIMARWNLRAAADLVGDDDERAPSWRAVADALVDGYDPATGVYEEFAGFHGLEYIPVADLGEIPFAADTILDHDRKQASQVVKQADVIMLHHLVPDEVEPGSAGPNLDYYGPRTSHGSSLSPAIHASVLAREGRTDEARRMFEMSAYLDLEDLTGTSTKGLHVATMGGVWQALVAGFLGVRAEADGTLVVDPHLPPEWGTVDVRFWYRGARVGVRAGNGPVEVSTDAPLNVRIAH
jgi:trehalose/maltose hydrolase-like predicted phosphorylase